MNINSRILKVSGKIELPPNKDLEMDKEVTLICQGSVVKISEGSNQDGTVDRQYFLKISTAEIQ
jgi:hypothetical protein